MKETKTFQAPTNNVLPELKQFTDALGCTLNKLCISPNSNSDNMPVRATWVEKRAKPGRLGLVVLSKSDLKFSIAEFQSYCIVCQRF